MARSKHSVALFEVIHRDKRFEGIAKRSAALKTPSWWFNRPKVQAAPIEAPAPAKAPVVETKVEATVSHAAKPPAALQAAPPRIARPPILPQLLRMGRQMWAKLLARVQEYIPRVTSPVMGVAIALVVCLAVLLARVISPGSSSKTVAIGTTEIVRQGAAHPDVLKVYDSNARRLSDTAPQGEAAMPAGNKVPASATREISLNYALIQSYTDEKSATDARDFLNRNGVACTIERGIKNWRKDFYLVVGMDGFIRVSGADYTAYRKRIETLSAEFSGPTHRKGFQPQAIKWDKTP